jgi:hypothetical protein
MCDWAKWGRKRAFGAIGSGLLSLDSADTRIEKCGYVVCDWAEWWRPAGGQKGEPWFEMAGDRGRESNRDGPRAGHCPLPDLVDHLSPLPRTQQFPHHSLKDNAQILQ